MKVEFDVKYGRNVIELPLNIKPSLLRGSLSNLFREKVTIYSDMTIGEQRIFVRSVVDECCVYGQQVEKNNSTVRTLVDSKTVSTKAVDRYKPLIEYMALPSNERENFYTVQAGDFVVFGEVTDETTNANEFILLQQKYKNNGFKIMSVNANINGMAVDNVTMTNV